MENKTAPSIGKPARSGKFAWRKIGGEAALVPTAGRRDDLDSMLVLNEVGTLIWGLLDGTRSRDDLLNAVREEFEVEEEVASRDLDEFLARLVQLNAVEEAAR